MTNVDSGSLPFSLTKFITVFLILNFWAQKTTDQELLK